MATTLERLTHDALELSEKERAQLAHNLIASMDGRPDTDAVTAWDAEISRRVMAVREGSVTGIPAAEVFAKLKAKYH